MNINQPYGNTAWIVSADDNIAVAGNWSLDDLRQLHRLLSRRPGGTTAAFVAAVVLPRPRAAPGTTPAPTVPTRPRAGSRPLPDLVREADAICTDSRQELMELATR